MASPAFGSAGTYLTGGVGNTANFAVPSGVAADDVIIVFFYTEDTIGSITAPGGFTLKSDVVVTANHRLLIFWKRATTSDAGTYNFTSANVEWRAGAAVRFTGVINSGDPFDVFNTNQAGSGTTTPAVSVTTTVADTLLVWIMSDFNGGTVSAPSGYTLRTLASTVESGLATVAKATTGGTGSVTAASPQNGAQTAFLGALKPNATSQVLSPTDARGTTDALTFDRQVSNRTDDRILTDTAIASLDLPRSFSDERTITDSINVLITRNVIVTDSRGNTDAVSRDFGINPGDGRGQTDSTSGVGVFTPVFTDERGLIDSPITKLIFGIYEDLRGLTDSVVTQLIPFGANDTTVNASEQRGLTDAPTTVAKSGVSTDLRGNTDSLQVSVLGSQNFTTSPTDNRQLTDTGTRYDREGINTDDRGITDSISVIKTANPVQTLDLTEGRGLTDLALPATDNGTPRTVTISDDRGIGDPTIAGGIIDIEHLLDEDRGTIDNLAVFKETDNQYTQSPTDVRGLTDTGTIKGYNGFSTDIRGLVDSLLVTFVAAPQTLSVTISEDRGLTDVLALQRPTLDFFETVGWTDDLQAAIGQNVILDLDDSRGLVDDTDQLVIEPELFFTTPTRRERRVLRGHGLWDRMYLDRGLSILRFGNSYQQIENPSTEQMESADALFIGGRTYHINSSEASMLIAAGYGHWVNDDPDAPIDEIDFSQYGAGAYGSGPYGA